MQTHFSYLHWTEATIAMYGLTEQTVLANQSPFFYANSILEIFPPVALGASVYMLPAGALTFPARLIDCLNAHCVTELCMTPSSFISIVHAGALRPGCLPHLKWGIMSGESMPWGPLERWMDAAPNAGWWHFYGSTEMFSVAVGKVARTHQLGDRLPVGRPFPLVHMWMKTATPCRPASRAQCWYPAHGSPADTTGIPREPHPPGWSIRWDRAGRSASSAAAISGISGRTAS